MTVSSRQNKGCNPVPSKKTGAKDRFPVLWNFMLCTINEFIGAERMITSNTMSIYPSA
jgi:hypothetical protein